MKAWERTVTNSKENLWVVTTVTKKLLCVRFRSRFFIKDGGVMLPVNELILGSEKL